jgi:hypothetical protein
MVRIGVPCRKDRNLLDKVADYIMEVMIPSNRPVTGTAISERILERVLKVVSPIVSAALSRVSKFYKLRVP